LSCRAPALSSRRAPPRIGSIGGAGLIKFDDMTKWRGARKGLLPALLFGPAIRLWPEEGL